VEIDSFFTTDHSSPCREPDPDLGSEIEGSFLRLHKLMLYCKERGSDPPPLIWCTPICLSCDLVEGAYILSNFKSWNFGREVCQSIGYVGYFLFRP